MRFFAVAFVFIGAASFAQTPQVPHKILFAGMTLTIHEDAKQEIQKDVDALTRSARYFNMKAERARTYFPIIEKIFKEENLPEDFKYLCLQESSLVPDAVSVSNAVGFWQFKDFTAQEMGLRVDNQIDERMNIVSSSRAAAQYIKKQNWYFNNWVLALQAYQMGKGGVIEAIGDKHNGEVHMVINSHTYWYVKKFLAHKIAFENAVGDAPQVKVSLYETKNKKSLGEIANEISIDENVLKEYNKWARAGFIPNDKLYSVVIPNGNMPKDFDVLVMNQSKPTETTTETKNSNVTADDSSTPKEKIETETKFHINGVPVMKALPNENVSSISKRVGIDPSKFIDYNDIAIDARIIAGNYYFIKPKKKKGAVSVYQTQAGDNLWLISQQQGIRLNRLKKLNPNIDDRSLASGIVVRLNNKAVEENLPVNNDEVAELGNESFAWGSQPLTENGKRATSTTISSNLIEEPQINNSSTTTVALIDTLQVAKPILSDTTKISTDTIIIYEVKPSDTLYSIARQFDATIKDIMEWNNKSSFSISVGEKIKIKKR